MIVVGAVLALLAAVLHAYIFWMESIAWTAPRTRATFGIASAEEAETTKPLAFNQGFYNLFLGIVAAVGAIALITGSVAVGSALVFAGAGSMAAAALVLLLSSPANRASALKQGTIPLLAVVALAVGLAL